MSDRLTDKEIEEIQKRAEAATEGPWTWEPTHPREPEQVLYQHVCAGSVGVCDIYHKEHLLVDWCGNDEFLRGRKGKVEDARFIAASRTDIPRLLDEVERLQDQTQIDAGRIETLVEEVERLRSGTSFQHLVHDLSDDDLRGNRDRIVGVRDIYTGKVEYAVDLATAAIDDEIQRRKAETTNE